jgi:hypothetical protein
MSLGLGDSSYGDFDARRLPLSLPIFSDPLTLPSGQIPVAKIMGIFGKLDPRLATAPVRKRDSAKKWLGLENLVRTYF